MTIRQAYRVSQRNNKANSLLEDKLELNGLVTLVHITVILGATITCFLCYQQSTFSVTSVRVQVAGLVLTALQDIFLAYNMFLILEEGWLPDIIRDEGRKISYKILDVVKQPRASASIADLDSSSHSESSDEETQLDISQRMLK